MTVKEEMEIVNTALIRKKIKEILAEFAIRDGAFLSEWNISTGKYTVSIEGDRLLEAITTLIQESNKQYLEKGQSE